MLKQSFTSAIEQVLCVSFILWINSTSKCQTTNISVSTSGNSNNSSAQTKIQFNSTVPLTAFVTAVSPQTPGLEYWLRTVLSVPTWVDVTTMKFRNDMQQRLVKVVQLAMERQQAKRYKLPESQQETVSEESIRVEVLNVTREGSSNRVTIVYLVSFNGYFIGANALEEDLKLVGSNEFSAYMGYPVQQVQSFNKPEEQEKQNLWIIGAVIGSTVGVLLLGWCILFVYYNTCGKAFHENNSKSIKKGKENDEQTSSPKHSEQRSSKEASKIYLISTDVQTENNNNDEEIKASQMSNWIVPLPPNSNQNQTSFQRQSSLQLSASNDSNQGISQMNNQQKAALTTNFNNNHSASATVNKAIHRQSGLNGLASPPSKSDSGGSATLKTNEEMQPTSSTMMDEDLKSGDQRFLNLEQQPIFGGASGFYNDISPGSFAVDDRHRGSVVERTDDIWSLYPFQRHQAADAVHHLTEYLISDHPRPGPSSSSTNGSILIHSNQFQTKRFDQLELTKTFGLI